MPSIDIRDWNNKKVGKKDLPDEIFDQPFREHLIHEAVRNYLAGLRAGTHMTKTRNEVSGSGRKPYRQKGTGRARQGGSRPPIHRGGGTAHGPRPRDYSYKMNVREKKSAMKSALSRKLRDGEIFLINDLSIDEPRTKSLVEKFGKIGVEDKALLVDSFENVNLALASRNHPKMQLVDAKSVSVYDIVNSRVVVISETAIDQLTEILGQ